MAERLADVWAGRDYPVLLEVTRRLDAGEDQVMVADLALELGMSDEDVVRAGKALSRRGLVRALGTGETEVLAHYDLSGEAYLLTGLHPNGDDAVSQLVSALRQAADEVADPEEKSRLRKLADGVGGVSRAVLGVSSLP